MTQQALAAQVGLTFQQIQKYENASNRVSASRLVLLAKALQVDPGYFFEGDRAETAGQQADERTTADELQEAWLLLRCYDQIKDAERRRKVLNVVKAAAAIL